MRYAVILALLAAEPLLYSQIGGPYPGGGQYPGSGPGLPLPWPHKRGGGGDKSSAPALSRTSGTLRKIDDKLIVIDVPDGRQIEFHRDGRTRFYHQDKEIAAADLKAGDEISVEASQDQQGYLVARSVYFERHAQTAQEPAAKPDQPGTVDAPAASRDPDDPGPPVLQRGAAARRAAPATNEADEPAVAAAPVPAARGDALIGKARQAAYSYAGGLPNYVCTEYMARYASSSRPVDWHPLDVVSANLVYEHGQESYREVAVNGKAVHKGLNQIDGAWSTGEFASVLLDLFSPSTAAMFQERGASTSAGTPARVYDFSVERPHAHWHVQAPSQAINPAYKGSVWIEPGTGRVLRIEMQARALPEEFPLDTVESAVDYQPVRIGEGEFLLPVHAESLGCERGSSNCSRNSIDFRNYHKYAAESDITFSK